MHIFTHCARVSFLVRPLSNWKCPLFLVYWTYRTLPSSDGWIVAPQTRTWCGSLLWKLKLRCYLIPFNTVRRFTLTNGRLKQVRKVDFTKYFFNDIEFFAFPHCEGLWPLLEAYRHFSLMLGKVTDVKRKFFFLTKIVVITIVLVHMYFLCY